MACVTIFSSQPANGEGGYSGEDASVGPLSVIVVDDATEIRELLRLILAETGCRVRFAEDVEQALDLIVGDVPDLLLLDNGLPGAQQGLDLCARIKTDSQDPLPVVVMLTADDDPRTIMRARALGADGYVVKPFTPTQILGLVDAFDAWRLRPARRVPAFWPICSHDR
ncbi:Transcriptional regulatory protein WalR [Thauera sp. GDN1]|uniref:response regulator n=1 Tax=Thauera sp. GDN1 TaxID=2944810 RepID=UPI002478AA51|nr:response regulator [Thauera sp. GDN1]WEN42150.1 Transcriptional regulatory protein WalR [Thauera sp. GDN1]